MHTPVLLKEVIESLKIKPNGKYIDATLGEAGYTLEILKRGGRVLAIDADYEQIKNLEFRMQNSELKQKLILENNNFADIEEIAKKNNFFPVDGIVFDLGLSLKQLKESGRGFSYNSLDEDLDMRLNINEELTAKEIINGRTKEELYEIFAKYSEDINSRTIAENIVFSRNIRRINTVQDLRVIIDQALGKKDEKVYSRIFQALRIAVNDEFDNLKKGLLGAIKVLDRNGRVVIITFHSLEDRIVKQFVRNNQLKFLTKKPIFGNRKLSYERSAKLRIIQKK